MTAPVKIARIQIAPFFCQADKNLKKAEYSNRLLFFLRSLSIAFAQITRDGMQKVPKPLLFLSGKEKKGKGKECAGKKKHQAKDGIGPYDGKPRRKHQSTPRPPQKGQRQAPCKTTKKDILPPLLDPFSAKGQGKETA